MRLLPDTHILIWAVEADDELSLARLGVARELLESPANEVLFSAVSIWEVAIKFARKLPGFTLDPSLLRRGLVRTGFKELPLTAAHAERVVDLPQIHKDPFDRLLLAQAIEEDARLITADRALGRYPGPILKV